MSRKLKKVLVVPGVLIIIFLLIILIRGFINHRYVSEIPEYPDLNTLSLPLREQISEAGKKAIRNPSAENLGMLGMVYHSSTYYEKAATCYRLAGEKSKKEHVWNYYLGYLNLELGDSKNALDNFRKVVESEPENYLALYYEGQALQNLGQTADAERIFRKIAEIKDQSTQENTLRKNSFPLKAHAMFLLARIYADTNHPDSAQTILEQIIRENITFGPAYRLLGNIYSERGDSSLGKKYFTRANDMAVYTPPSDPLIDRLALISRSDAYLLRQIDVTVQSLNPEFTIELLNNALKYFPDNKYLISKAVSLFLLMGNGKAALPYLSKHLYYFKDDYKEIMDVADMLYDNGYRKEAMEYFNQAKKSAESKPDTQSQLAIWLLERGMNADAIALINGQLNTAPENTNVLVDAVYIYLLNGDTKKAGPLLSRLNKLRPSDALTIKMNAIMSEKEGDLKSAIRLYEKSFRADPEDMSTIKYLGMIYMREKMWKEALNFFGDALKFHPNEPYLLEILGRIYVTCPDEKLRDYQKGREFSERAFYRFTTPPMTQVSAGINLSLAYEGLGDRKNASANINKTLSLARKAKAGKDYIDYIEGLSKKFSLAY